ncbi:MAG: hypothetical protein HGB10_08510 [Coriobacteriia bacterium]|nr:hypothetical protein [Coriobacteriia bacterium]
MKTRSIGTIAVAAALVAALAVPMFAQATAGSGTGTGTGSGTQLTAQQRADRAAARKAARKAKKDALEAARKAKKAARQAARSSEASATKGQREEQLKNRISNILAARDRRFDAATANITKRIGRVSALTDKVEGAGGNVGGVRSSLDAARGHLATALALEADAADLFNAVPGASNRRAAFTTARAKGRGAVAELKLARSSVRDAAQALRVIVRELRSQNATETVNAQ